MRIVTLALLSIFIMPLSGQSDLTTEQWQQDIRYLQQKVIEEYQPLFLKITQDEWSKAVDNLYNDLHRMEDHEVIVGIAELIAKFGYGHTNLWLTAWRYNRVKDFQQMPYNMYWFTDGVYIQGIHQDYEGALGARVLKIGDTPIDQALEAVKPIVSVENEQFFKAHGLYYLGVPEVLHAVGVIDDMSSVTLTLEKSGRQFPMRFLPRPSQPLPGYYGLIQSEGEWLDARPGARTPYWLKHLNKKYYYEYIDKHKVVYVRQSEVQDDTEEDIAAFYTRVFEFVEQNDVEKLILDLRLNSGGNNYKNKPVVTGLIKSKINVPGKLFVILGRRTFSACQNLVNELENYTEAIFVGEPTAENVNFFGDSRMERLPNSDLAVRLSYLWWQDKDPRDNRPWTPPHIPVEMSSRDYINNVDPVLDTILNRTIWEKPIEPWDHLAGLFMQGKTDELKKTAKAFVGDPKYRFYDFEGRIEDASIQLMGLERLQEAYLLVKLNTELYPESPRSWSMLATYYLKTGELKKARSIFQKVVSLDSESPFGEKAKNHLSDIENK